MLHQRTRLIGSISGLCTAAALLTGCGAQQGAAPPGQSPSPSAPQQPGQSQSVGANQISGTFEPYKQGATAITYDPQQVPPGSHVTVSSQQVDGRTTVTLKVQGLQPNREYGGHVHTKPCGPRGEDAGPHFQEKADPVKPSVDPAYANPQNEVWLDFQTDAQGNGTVTAEGSWPLDTREDAQSVVIHEMHTHTEPGKAGTAGGRLACIDAKF
jgi:superoxide dismutase, Cu-Zn family